MVQDAEAEKEQLGREAVAGFGERERTVLVAARLLSHLSSGLCVLFFYNQPKPYLIYHLFNLITAAH
jgi:hypothetical protein